MKEQIRNINNKQPTDGSGIDPLFEINDLMLFETIGEYMKGWLDIEDVKNDPAFAVANETVKDMITDYNKNVSNNKENENFIKDDKGQEKYECINRPGGSGEISCFCRASGAWSRVTVIVRILSGHYAEVYPKETKNSS